MLALRQGERLGNGPDHLEDRAMRLGEDLDDPVQVAGCFTPGDGANLVDDFHEGLLSPRQLRQASLVVLVDLLEAVEERIDTGVTMITPENLSDPASQELVDPPVEQYLSGE